MITEFPLTIQEKLEDNRARMTYLLGKLRAYLEENRLKEANQVTSQVALIMAERKSLLQCLNERQI